MAPSAKNTPEEAVNSLVAAVRSGNVKAYGDELGARSRAMFEFAQAIETYWDVLNARFGSVDQRQNPPSIKDEMSIVVRSDESIQVREQKKIDATTVAITIWKVKKRKPDGEAIWEETWHAVLENDRWKIVLPPKGKVHEAIRTGSDGKDRKVEVLQTRAFDAGESAKEVRYTTKIRRRIEAVTQELRDGKYKSLEEAEQAVRKGDPELND